ncbi:MAG: hypothetical protein ACYDD4_02845 [Acidimicrobiales bacterium]
MRSHSVIDPSAPPVPDPVPSDPPTGPVEPLAPVDVPEREVVDVPEPGVVDVPEPAVSRAGSVRQKAACL